MASLEREPSALMLKLNEQALQSARMKVAAKFQTAADLEDFSGYLMQIQKANVQADTQLSLAVQAKLEALKRAKDIMDESSSKLNILFNSIKKTDAKIIATNTEITKYDYLCRISNAKENIERVLSQVEYFRNVPKKVAKLNETLDNEPARLKEVFKEALSLDALRQALLKEVKGQDASTRRRASEVQGKSNKGTYSEESYSKVKDLLEKHLKLIPDLMKRIRSQIYGYVDRFMEVGVDSPQDLVMAFEIVEMHQEYLERRRDQNRERATALIKIKMQAAGGREVKFIDPEVAANENYEDVSKEIQERVESVLIAKINSRFEIIKLQCEEDEKKSNKETSKVKSILHGATQLMADVTEFRNDINPCFPPEWNAMDMVVRAVETHLVPEITGLTSNNNASRMDVGDILKLMDWIEYYIQQMKNMDQGSNHSVDDFLAMTNDLKNEYIVRVKEQMVQWFENIENRPKEIIKTQEELLITSHPEDKFNCLYSQFNVAKEKLPKDHLHTIIDTCLAVLRDGQRKTYETLCENWQTAYDAESLCALINDNDRMATKCEEFGTTALELIPPHQNQEMLIMKEKVMAIADEYIIIAVEGLSVLGKCILIDLDEPVFSKIYTVEWETGTRLTETLTATLDDYLNDISNWIPKFYFSKLVRNIFGYSVDLYCMSLRKLSNGVFHFMNELVATGMVAQDMQILLAYFTKWEAALKVLGEKVAENDETNPDKNPVVAGLKPISIVATLISATRLAELEENSVPLFEKYGIDGLKLVNSIIMANPVLSKGEKMHFSEKLLKVFEGGTYLDPETKKQVEFNRKPIPLFESFDAVNLDAKKPEEKKSRFNFWNKG